MASAVLKPSSVDAAMVLAKATTRAAQFLGLSGTALSTVIGLSEPTVSRVINGARGISPDSKEGELALILVRVFRSLDALVGTDDARRELWLNTHNNALGGVPRKLLLRADGLVATLNYLDGMRAPI